MKKYWTSLLAVTLAAMLIVGVLVGCEDKTPEVTIPVMDAMAIGSGPKVPFYAFLEVEDLEADTWYVLVDLSDKTYFPHRQTNSINLKQINLSGVLSETKQWDIHIGVVGENDATDGYVEWLYTSHRIRNTQFDEVWTLPEHGLNLAIKSDDTPMFFTSVEFTTTVQISTGHSLASPVARSGVITTYAGAGDLVMFIDEVEAGGYLDLSVGVAYETE